MDKFYDVNYAITDFRTEKGEIVDLEINHKHIDLANYDENKNIKVIENGKIEIVPSEDKNGMKKVTVTTDVQPNLDNNKGHTIDVSLYDSPIEITPSYKKDGMKKVTVSLKNIHNDLYAWKHSNDLIYSLEIPTTDKTLNIYVSKNKTEIIGHTLYMHEYADLKKDIGRYVYDGIEYNEQKYFRSSEDDIRL